MLHLEVEWPLKQNILIADTILAESILGGKYIFRGKYFCFYHMFKTIFFSTTKFWGAQKRFGGNFSRIPHRDFRPWQNRRKKVFHWGPSCLCKGAGHSEIAYLIHNMNNIFRLCK